MQTPPCTNLQHLDAQTLEQGMNLALGVQLKRSLEYAGSAFPGLST